MKVKVRFKCIDFSGGVVKTTVKFDCPDFKNEEGTFNANGHQLPYKTTINQQIIEWLDNQDKSDLMDKYGWYNILNYEVVEKKVKEKKVTINEMIDGFLSGMEHSEQIKIDFIATYIKMSETIKGLPVEERFKIVLNTLEVGYIAQTEAYKHSIKLIKSISDGDLFLSMQNDKLIDNNWNS